MFRIILFLPLLVILSSCGSRYAHPGSVHRTSFDCRPGNGIGCGPVGEVISLIVQREEGEDLFLQNTSKVALLKQEIDLDSREEVNPKQSQRSYQYILAKNESGELVLTKIEEKHGYRLVK